MQAAYRRDDGVIEAIRAASPPRDIFEAAAFGELDRFDGDPNVYSADGFTPLHFAVMGGSVEAVRRLLDAGADPNAMSRHRFVKVRPLHTATAADISTPNAEIIRALVAGGADPDGRTAEGGATPLHNAAQSASVELVRTLLELGADPQAAMDDGRTPADLASSDEIRALLGG